MKTKTTIAARDLTRGDTLWREGHWWAVGEAKPDWGTVVALDYDGEFIAAFNHGDPVEVIR